MIILIPLRIFRAIPGLVVAVFFLFVGIGTGHLATNLFVHPWHCQMVELVCVPAFACCTHFIWNVWRQNDSSNFVSQFTAVSPRILAVLGSVCLIGGLGMGGVVTWLS